MLNRKNFADDLKTQVGNNYTAYGANGDWCLLSVIKNYKKHGIPVPEIYSCSRFVASSFVNRDNRTLKNDEFETAEIGDLIFFENNNPNDGVDHVGIVVSNDGSRVTVWEGNTSATDRNNWWKTSKVTLNTYTYAELHAEPLNCIIDMSEYFEDDNPVNTDTIAELNKRIDELLKELEQKNQIIAKMKEVVKNA